MPWQWPRLICRQGHDAIIEFYDVVNTIVVHEVTLQGLQETVEGDWPTLKDRCHEGAVWMNRRMVDLGNWRYTLLFQMVQRLAEHKKDTCKKMKVIHELGVQLADKYATLHLKHPATPESLSKKGDVWEICLAISRETGPNIPAQLRVQRESFNESMVKFTLSIERIIKVIWTCDARDHRVHHDGPPFCREMPWPDDMAKVIFYARGVVKASGTNEASRIMRNFEITCWAADASIRSR